MEKEIKIKSGIYLITNTVNNKVYVGSTTDFKARWRCHRSMLDRNCHFSKHLQLSWNKYGSNNFTFTVLEYMDTSIYSEQEILDKETFYIDKYDSTNKEFGYNSKKIAETSIGIKWNEESRKKFSEYRKNHIVKEAVEALKEYSKTRIGKTNEWAKEWYSNLSEEEKSEFVQRQAEGRKKAAEERGYWHSQKTIDKIIQTKKDKNLIKVISLYNLDGSLYKIYESYSDCLREFSDNAKNSSVLQNCMNSGKLYNGYIVSLSTEPFIPDFENIKIKVNKNKNNRIYQKYDKDWNLIDSFSSGKEAAQSVGLIKQSNQMLKAFKTGELFKNYYWKIIEPYNSDVISKEGEFGGSPINEDNTEPSIGLTSYKGVTTNS